jgi:hypothetical protein
VLLRANELALNSGREVVKFIVTDGDSDPEAVQRRVWGDTGLLNFTQSVTLHKLCLFIHYLKACFACCAVVYAVTSLLLTFEFHVQSCGRLWQCDT